MKYQGIKAPIERTENDFDPGAKSHILSNTPYIRFFFSEILPFIFHKQACKLAKDTGPLHQCSIYRSKTAGKALGDMLALGRSKPWPEVLKQYTGSEKLSAQPIREYFNPLIVWLKKYRSKENYKLGWDTQIGNKDNFVISGAAAPWGPVGPWPPKKF
jgi:peptidyl-dipeptidase A